MKKALLLAFVFAVCLWGTAAARTDVHRELDEKLLLLRHGTSYQKIGVLEYLAGMRDKEVFAKRRIREVVFGVLRSSSQPPRVRAAAAEAVRKLVEARMITSYSTCEALPPLLGDETLNLLVRAACVRALGAYMRVFPNETRNQIYIKKIRDLLNLPTTRNALKVEALKTLCDLGDEAAQSALKIALANPDLVDMAVASLRELLRGGGNITDVVIAIRLLAIFTDSSIAVPTRVKAGECLCFLVQNGLKGNYALEDVTALLSDRKTDARLIPVACRILFTINNRRSLMPIVERLDDEELDEPVRIVMVEILADFLNGLKVSADTQRAVNNALSFFARVLRKKDEKDASRYKYGAAFRRVCAYAAGMVAPGFNRKGAVLILISALEDPDEGVASTALEGLIAITNQNFGRKPEAWRKWFEKYAATIH